MTEDLEAADAAEAAGRPLLRRAFAAEFEAGDGRTIHARIVPYGVPADVADVPGRIYREEWAPGCFAAQLRAASRVKVLLNFEHQQGLRGIVGHGISLDDRADGLYGDFRVKRGADGDTALELVEAGVLDGLSLEAYAHKTIRTADGVQRRVDARLVNVALCRNPAFEGAGVLAVREEPAIVFDEELLPLEVPQEQLERARRLGVRLPEVFANRLTITE